MATSVTHSFYVIPRSNLDTFTCYWVFCKTLVLFICIIIQLVFFLTFCVKIVFCFLSLAGVKIADKNVINYICYGFATSHGSLMIDLHHVLSAPTQRQGPCILTSTCKCVVSLCDGLVTLSDPTLTGYDKKWMSSNPGNQHDRNDHHGVRGGIEGPTHPALACSSSLNTPDPGDQPWVKACRHTFLWGL